MSKIAIVDAEPIDEAPVRPVEKNFKYMRDSVQGPDYTPYPIIRGFILKIGEDNDNLRWFELKNHYLSYWDRKHHFEKGAHPAGTFDLRQVKHMWLDSENFDIVFRFTDNSIRILNFDVSQVTALRKWYQEIEKRMRYFRGLGPDATAETSLDTMRRAAQARGIDVGTEKHKHQRTQVDKLKRNARNLGVRRATLAVPAAPLVKRFGYRQSVVQQDMTPYPRVQGYLTKLGDKKYYQLNNEYMSYWKNKDAWQKNKSPLGSYNIIHFADVTQVGCELRITFVTGERRSLIAANSGIARQWKTFIDARRSWFTDVNTAAESVKKMQDLKNRGQAVRRKSIEQIIQNIRARRETDSNLQK